MSAIGISVIENGSIVSEYYSLVNPEQHFDAFNIDLTGIDERMVANAPTFPQLWTKIEPLMSSGLLVAHNAVFDMNVLKNVCAIIG
ncbi:MAG: exonuclease domain-containing protein [Ruminococcus sp.]